MAIGRALLVMRQLAADGAATPENLMFTKGQINNGPLRRFASNS